MVFGTYMIKVDTIAAARTTRAEMSQIWKAVQEKFVADDQVRGASRCGHADQGQACLCGRACNTAMCITCQYCSVAVQ